MGAAVRPPWNTCTKRGCGGLVEGVGGTVTFHDGDEAKCSDCGRPHHVYVTERGPCRMRAATRQKE